MCILVLPLTSLVWWGNKKTTTVFCALFFVLVQTGVDCFECFVQREKDEVT